MAKSTTKKTGPKVAPKAGRQLKAVAGSAPSKPKKTAKKTAAKKTAVKRTKKAA